MARGRKYREALESYDRDAVYSWVDAVKILKDFPRRKYDETVELSINLGIDGPRGLMPNPKTGTVTREIAQAVQEAKAGRVEYRADSKSGNNAQAPIGKLSFEDQALIENAQAFTDAILRARPAATKGQYVRKLILSSVMGPGVKIDRAQLAA